MHNSSCAGVTGVCVCAPLKARHNIYRRRCINAAQSDAGSPPRRDAIPGVASQWRQRFPCFITFYWCYPNPQLVKSIHLPSTRWTDDLVKLRISRSTMQFIVDLFKQFFLSKKVQSKMIVLRYLILHYNIAITYLDGLTLPSSKLPRRPRCVVFRNDSCDLPSSSLSFLHWLSSSFCPWPGGVVNWWFKNSLDLVRPTCLDCADSHVYEKLLGFKFFIRYFR